MHQHRSELAECQEVLGAVSEQQAADEALPNEPEENVNFIGLVKVLALDKVLSRF